MWRPNISDRRARRLLALAAGAGALLLALLLRQADPAAPGSPWPPCPLHALTGWLCPGCGSTRALHALLHGDLARALAMNPLLLLALALLPLLATRSDRWRRPLARGLHAALVDARAWAVLVIGYAVLRNLPLPALAWLAPG